MKKVIIIGATGEVGMYVTDYFCADSHSEFEIIAVGKRKTDFFDKYGVKYYDVDICDSKDFEKLPQEDVWAVVCTAAMMPGRMEGYEPMRYLTTNVCGMLNVLEYCKKVKADRIIYTQTIRDVGNKIGKEIIMSDSPRDFSYKGDHAVYVISKNAAVDLIEHYYQEYGLKRFIFRLPTIYLYSPNRYYFVDGKKRVMGFRHMIEQAIAGKEIEVWGDPDKAHDITYVKDLARLFYLACKCENTAGGVYNVGTGIPVTLKEQVEGMVEVFGDNKAIMVYCPEKPNARHYNIDITKTSKELGYYPQYSYLDYLQDFKKEMEEDRFRDLFDASDC